MRERFGLIQSLIPYPLSRIPQLSRYESSPHRAGSGFDAPADAKLPVDALEMVADRVRAERQFPADGRDVVARCDQLQNLQFATGQGCRGPAASGVSRRRAEGRWRRRAGTLSQALPSHTARIA